MNVPKGHPQTILPIQYSRDLHMTPLFDGYMNEEIAEPTCRETIIYGEWFTGREMHRSV